MSKLRLFVISIIALMMSACSGFQVKYEDGTIHHLIIGVGVVSTKNKDDASSVQVTRSNVLGLHVSNQPGLKVGMGYLSSSTLRVPLDANLTIEVEEKPMGTIVVNSKNYNGIGNE